MVEVWLFGRLVATLASAFALVLVIVALTSVTYLAQTLVPALRLPPGGDRAARRLALSAAGLALAAAFVGLRVGAPGSGGEIIPSLAVGVAAAAALGASAAFGALGGARAVLFLGAARGRRTAALEGRRQGEVRRLAEAKRAFLSGDDLRAQLAEAEAAVVRLREALAELGATRDEVARSQGRLDEAGAAGDLGRELRRTSEEVATKLDLGGRILSAAEAAAFRVACSEPIQRLLRRRPKDLAAEVGTDGVAVPETMARLAGAAAAIDAFLMKAGETRAALTALEDRRLDRFDDEDPWARAVADLESVEEAYQLVRERIDVVRMRLAARAQIDAVAAAAGEVSEKARASGLPARDLAELVDEMVRAESAILMATPGDFDARALAAALARGTEALGGHDGASLDELLRALRELS